MTDRTDSEGARDKPWTLEGTKDPEFLTRLGRMGQNVLIFETAILLQPESIVIDEGVRIDDYVKIEGGTGVSLGRWVHIASFASILGGGSATLGAFAGLAQGSRLVTGGGHPFEGMMDEPPPPGDVFERRRSRVVVGANALVGANAVVLPDVTVGEGGVVAAGSVVTTDVPEWTVVSGAPAKPVRERTRFGI